MLDERIEDELQAGIALVRRFKPASILLRLSCDRYGTVRLQAEGLDIRLRDLDLRTKERGEE